MKWISFIIILFFAGTVEASPSVDIAFPTNDTIFNFTTDLNVSSNETITTWYYSLDGGVNTTFTPNETLAIGRGNHNLVVTAWNGTVNNTKAVFFTVDYIEVQVLDLETEVNVSNGINTRIMTTLDVILGSNTTNASGGNFYEGIGYGTYKVQAGGPAGSSYPHINTYNITFSSTSTNFEVLLPSSVSCHFVTYQYVDSFYKTPLDGVSVQFRKAAKIITEVTTGGSGFTSLCLVPGLAYILESSRTDYVTANFTDNAALTSQFIQMIRTTLATITDAEINMNIYPEENTFLENDTIDFGMWISSPSGELTEYGIVYGRDPITIRDDSIAADNPLFKYRVVSGSNPNGAYIHCVDTNRCLDTREWKGAVVYVGYFYKRTGEDKIWVIRRIALERLIEENFYTNYTSLNNPKEAIHNLFASVGYASLDPGKPSLGMITFSMFMMIFSAAGAAGKGWGIIGSMVVFLGVNVIMILLGLIQWWSLLISFIFIAFLSKKFGSVFT